MPGEGFILLHTHYEKANEHRLFTMTSDDGKSWSERQTFSMIPKGQYQISWPDPRDPHRIATAFDFHPNGLDTRTNVYYLETRDRGNAAFPGDQVLPSCLDVTPQGRHETKTGDDDTSHHSNSVITFKTNGLPIGSGSRSCRLSA